MVATNDSHFLTPADHEAHDILLCIGLGKDRNDPRRMRYDEGLYFKDPSEMAERFPDRPDVVENTLKISDEVDLLLEQKYQLPAFPLPKEHTSESDYLEYLAVEGAKGRYGDPLPGEVQERLDYEMGVIRGTGYAGYFLITADFIQWARDHEIPVGPGRGSAAGSLVAYALGITNLDPLRFGLLFERFLNPERISMPDIDIDFCYERRGEVIEYTREKYGKDAVGQIVTFGTMKSRAVIRDVGRALGFEPSETDRIAKLIPNQPGQAYTVQEAVDGLKEVKELYKLDERHRQLFDYSITLEGLSRHASVHAAGVVIAPGPLDDYVPVSVQTGKNGGSSNGDAMVVTQYDMNCLDQVGMLKMDFLGLKTLTVIHDAVEMVRARYGQLTNPDTGESYTSVDDIPLDDPAVFRMLAKGGTAGVFQFESNLANDKLRAMKCDRFDDLVATNALIRPGPLDSGMTDVYIGRKTGRLEVAYPHPDLEEILEPTYGVIVYQEQVMRIASELAGFTLGEADVLRKAVGKKIAELIKKELGTFVDRSVERGVDRRIAEDLAEQIETFGRYGFNLSHSAAYSLISYHTAWFKAHLPGRVHGRVAVVRAGQHGQRGEVHRRVPRPATLRSEARRAGRRAAARRQRVRLEVHRHGGVSDPLRAWCGPRCRARGRPVHHWGARGRPVHVALRLPGAHRYPGAQQASVRSAHRGRRPRRVRGAAPSSSPGSTPHTPRYRRVRRRSSPDRRRSSETAPRFLGSPRASPASPSGPSPSGSRARRTRWASSSRDTRWIATASMCARTSRSRRIRSWSNPAAWSRSPAS